MRRREAAAGPERNPLSKGGKPMAGLCLRRSARLPRCSDGAGLARFIASAVTERSSYFSGGGKNLSPRNKGNDYPAKNKSGLIVGTMLFAIISFCRKALFSKKIVEPLYYQLTPISQKFFVTFHT